MPLPLENVRYAGLAETVEHPTLGAIGLLSNPLRPTAVRGRTVRTAQPELGEHSRSVPRSYGLGATEIDALISAGTVAATDSRSEPCKPTSQAL